VKAESTDFFEDLEVSGMTIKNDISKAGCPLDLSGSGLNQ
jgi:hypothetical protein